MEPGKRKISVRKIIQTLVTVIVTGICVVAITSASRIQEQKKVRQVHIQVDNAQVCGFVNAADIHAMLFEDRHIQTSGLSLESLNILQMEHIATANPWIGNAQVYLDNQRDLHIDITQRVPAFRVFDVTGNSYYLDRELKPMPLSDKYTYYAVVVNNVPLLKDDSLSNDLKAQMLHVVQTVSHDTFWHAQVQEINVLQDRGFELVPVIGNHRIWIGDSSRLTDKLSNVFTFYKQVLNKVGWDKYQLLDTRYKGQVVASPALAWKVPVDRAMSNMNWVKSIMDAAPKESGANDMPLPAAPPQNDKVTVAVPKKQETQKKPEDKKKEVVKKAPAPQKEDKKKNINNHHR